MEKIVVGRISGAFGVRGWVRVQSFTEPPENLHYYPLWCIEIGGSWRPLETEERIWQGGRLLVRIKDCNDRNRARELAGHNIGIASGDLPNLGDGEYYWHQLQGLRVVSTDNECLGRIDRLLETGANDVLVVVGCDGSIDGKERLIPYLPGQVVQQVDLAAGEMRVDWDPSF